MKDISVAIAVRAFPNIVQTYILSQLAGFRKLGINFTVIAANKHVYKQLPLVIKKYRLLDRVTYICTDRRNIVKTLLTLPITNTRFLTAAKNIVKFNSWGGHPISYRFKALIRARALAFNKIDIIHSHSMFSSYDYLFMKEILSIPMVTTYHGQVPKGVKRIEKYMMDMIFTHNDAFIVNTFFAKTELIELGCPAKKINIIPQGIILEDFPFTQRHIDLTQKIIFLTIGRLSIEKGHHIALLALKTLSQSFPMLEYHIVGHGPRKEELETICKEYGISNKVVFHGFKTGNELTKVLGTAHILTLPSINTGDGYLVETQGVVLQEAQASGIPVIGSHTGGIPDVITDEVTGLLFKENDHNDLARKIQTLIDNPDIYRKLSLLGRQDVESRFDINIVCKNLTLLYKNILQSASRPAQ